MSAVLVGMFDNEAAASQAHARLTSGGFDANEVMMTGGGNTGGSTSSTRSSDDAGSDESDRDGPISRFFRRIFGDGNDSGNDVYRRSYTDDYTEAFNRGSYAVSVTAANDAQMERAVGILNDCGAVDIDEKAQSWRRQGSTGGAADRSSGASEFGVRSGMVGGFGSSGGMARAMSEDHGTTASTMEDGARRRREEVVEDEPKVAKRAAARGGVRIFRG